MAPYISEATGSALRESGWGHADLSGNVHIEFGQVLVSRCGRPNRFPPRRSAHSIFARKSGRIVRTLLEGPKGAWTISGPARTTKVSIAQVQKVRDALVERGFVEFVGRADLPAGQRAKLGMRARPFRVTAPGRLLDRWAEKYHPPANRFEGYYTLQKDRRKLLERLAGPKSGCVLTGYAAAEQLAPFVRTEIVHVYAHDYEAVEKRNGLQPATRGATVFVSLPRDDWTILDRFIVAGNLHCAGPVRVYLDLMSFKGRAVEQAEILRKKVLGY